MLDMLSTYTRVIGSRDSFIYMYSYTLINRLLLSKTVADQTSSIAMAAVDSFDQQFLLYSAQPYAYKLIL